IHRRTPDPAHPPCEPPAAFFPTLPLSASPPAGIISLLSTTPTTRTPPPTGGVPFCLSSDALAMADTVLIQTEKRDGRGSRAAANLRQQGKIPAVVYGHKEETLSVTIDHDTLMAAIRHNTRVVDIAAGGKTEKAQIVELQWDHLGKDVLHVDFKRVSADERIEQTVPIEIRGIAPGVAEGGRLDQPLHTLRVECPALNIPTSIRVPINDLHLEGAIHVRDLKLPEGVKALTDPDAIVIHVVKPKVEAAPAAGEPAAASAEPEVITRKKAEEEGAEE